MTDPSQPVRVTNLRGRVTRGPYAAGSKSEREAVFIETADARYLLRRKSGPVFADAELERYVGHAVVCDGFVLGTALLADSIEEVQ
jgi:hypothetical protein